MDWGTLSFPGFGFRVANGFIIALLIAVAIFHLFPEISSGKVLRVKRGVPRQIQE